MTLQNEKILSVATETENHPIDPKEFQRKKKQNITFNLIVAVKAAEGSLWNLSSRDITYYDDPFNNHETFQSGKITAMLLTWWRPKHTHETTLSLRSLMVKMLHWPDLQKGYNKCSHSPQYCFLKTMLRTMWTSLVLFWSIIYSKLQFGDKKKIHDKWMHVPSSQAQVPSSKKTGCECTPWTGKLSQLQTTPRVQNGHISVIQLVCRFDTCSNTSLCIHPKIQSFPWCS